MTFLASFLLGISFTIYRVAKYEHIITTAEKLAELNKERSE